MWNKILGFKKPKIASADAKLIRQFSELGVEFTFRGVPAPKDALDTFDMASSLDGDEKYLATYLAQLVSEELADFTGTSIQVTWPVLFSLLADASHQPSLDLFNLPPSEAIVPAINCRETLSDKGFQIFVEYWLQNGSPLHDVQRTGAVLNVSGEDVLLDGNVWQLTQTITDFSHRPDVQHSQHNQELAWGKFRAQAEAVGASISSKYLRDTYVITPNSLMLPLERLEVAGERIIKVSPTFKDAPEGWLAKFDQLDVVPEHYDFSIPQGGRCRVIISEPVRRVLNVIKKQMPGRRVGGAKAEAFIRNPFAFLGEDANEVINEDDFQESKAEAGILPSMFVLLPATKDGHIQNVELCITTLFRDGSGQTDIVLFAEAENLSDFLKKLERALMADRQFFSYGEFDLDLDGESARQLEEGRQLLHLWVNQSPNVIGFDDVYSLEQYGERIEGIGISKPIYSAFIKNPKGDEDSWAPSDLLPILSITLPNSAERVFVELSKEWVDEFDSAVVKAEQEGDSEVTNSKLPTSLATTEARKLADAFKSMLGVEDRVKPEGTKKSLGELSKKRETLLVKGNVQKVDYIEQRKSILALPKDAKPVLPKSLRSNVKLKPHQEYGVAWFQHLIARSPSDCRGALLADDMGVGKTLQLLTVLAWYYENNPDAAPSLIVAPVSLLDNWQQEADRFFSPSFPKILVLYGEVLRELKQPKDYIDERLVERGITNLLKPGWMGDSKLILTNYETLASLEFSLAKEYFAFMICDEAQKIKTPNTLVTLVAKKLKVAFKVACTGTPVENTLADLWCLFDFIQPGLLGSLDEFGRTYRRPIEAKTDEQVASVERLRQLITPQLLRRTKEDIADQLPKKFFVVNVPESNRLEVEMSNYQRQLYVEGLKKLRATANEESARKRAQISFGILHFIKAVCAEPFCLPGARFAIDKDGFDAHMVKSPKAQWMLNELDRIKALDEKVILFTELREVQNALVNFLNSRFGVKPYIINGDTKFRQGIIDRFQKTAGFDVIILSPLAAGVGLNIVSANHVIHFTRTWNPAKEAQATDRAYRIGQEKDVYVYCPTIVARDFTTFEAKLDQLMLRKRDLADDMLNGIGSEIGMGDIQPEGPEGDVFHSKVMVIDDIDRLDGESFEIYCKLLWEKQGFVSNVTKKGKGDGGVDVLALIGKNGILVQCKNSSVTEIKLGWDAVKEVVGGAIRYQTYHPGVKFGKTAITNQFFNKTAQEQAELNKVVLIMRPELEKLLEKFPVMNTEFYDELSRTMAERQLR